MAASGTLAISITLSCLLALMNITETDGQFRMKGGFNTVIDNLPYLASLRFKHLEYSRHVGRGMFCHATVIHNRVLITTAYCIYDKDQEDVIVVIGNTYLEGMSYTLRALEISAWRVHALFYGGGIPYDIGLVFTREEIYPAMRSIAYLPLNLNIINPGTKCLVAGWGLETPAKDKEYANQPSGVWLETVSRLECYEYIREPGFMCTKIDKDIGPSVNDMGGALVCDYKLSGITCKTDDNDQLTAFTDIRIFAKWIHAAIYLYFNGTLRENGVIALRSICVQKQIILAIIMYVATNS